MLDNNNIIICRSHTSHSSAHTTKSLKQKYPNPSDLENRHQISDHRGGGGGGLHSKIYKHSPRFLRFHCLISRSLNAMINGLMMRVPQVTSGVVTLASEHAKPPNFKIC